MFDRDFYPTPVQVIDIMLEGINLSNKTILEPSAGKGDIVDYCLRNGAKQVIACEKHDELRKIIATKCKVIASDFLTVTSEMISHVEVIVMNPPYSADEHHILHAYNIAPAGCAIIALCNLNTLENTCNRYRRELKRIVDDYGCYTDLGNCFSDGERNTGINIALIQIKKAGGSYDAEFEGFFMEEEEEDQANGIISYNFIRDLVNRYVAAIKLFDQQLEVAVKMNQLTSTFFNSSIAMSCTEDGKPKLRNDYKKDLQKSAWKYIFQKLNMQKYATKGLKEDINKFVEQQESVPFTMKNIYRMLEIVIGTQSQRMDKAIIEVFDKITMHYNDNRYNVEGWKTNSHYLINQKFIIDWMVGNSWGGGMELKMNNNAEIIEDMMKAICYLTGKNYDDFLSLEKMVGSRYKLKDKRTGMYLKENRGTYSVFYTSNKPDDWSFQNAIKTLREKGIDVEVEDSKPQWGKWFDWGFFEVRGYKKGTMHFKFKDQEVWAKFNQRVAKIKGYPLFESTSKQAA